MTQLTAALPRRYSVDDVPMWNEFVVTSGATIYAGSAVAVVIATGVARQLTGDSTVEKFVGWADETVLGDGTKRVRVRQSTRVNLPITGVTGAVDTGKPVYASDGNTFSLTQGTNDPQIGVVSRHEASTECVVSSKADTLH